jgi:hypothetical protein
MQSGPRAPRCLVSSSADDDEISHHEEMPTSASLQRSPPIHPLRIPGAIPASPAGPLPELAEGSKPLAIQYALMLKVQNDREAAIAFRQEHQKKASEESFRKVNIESHKKKGCCNLF